MILLLLLPLPLPLHRHRHPELRRTTYANSNDIQWHGEVPFQPDWSDASRLVAFTIGDGRGEWDALARGGGACVAPLGACKGEGHVGVQEVVKLGCTGAACCLLWAAVTCIGADPG
jgi:hypothetical protein